MQNVRVQEDLLDQHPWKRIEETFVDVGDREQLVSRLTLNHDGTMQQEDFVEGVLRHHIQVNNPDQPIGDRHKPWAQIETRFSESGAKIQTTTFYASGEIRDRLHRSAVPEERLEKYDPRFLIGIKPQPWETVVVTFDAESQIIQRDYVFVDGSSRSEQYADGFISEVLQEESAQKSQKGDGTGWASVVTIIGPDKVVTKRLTVLGNGEETEEEYRDGKLHVTKIPPLEKKLGLDGKVAQPSAVAPVPIPKTERKPALNPARKPALKESANPQRGSKITPDPKKPAGQTALHDLFDDDELDTFVFSAGG